MTVSTVGSSKPISNVTNVYRGTATALLTSTNNSSSSESKCDVCDRLGHYTKKCLTLKRANVSERRRLLRAEHLCFKCLKPHMSYRCNECCSTCGYNHHYMICPSLEPKVTSAPDVYSHKVQQGGERSTSSMPLDVTDSSACSKLQLSLPSKNDSYSTVLQTTQARVKNHKGQTLNAEVIFDLASDRSYVTSTLVKRCGLEYTGLESLSRAAFGEKCYPKPNMNFTYDLELVDPQGQTHSISAIEVDSITTHLERKSLPRHILEKFNHLPLASDYSKDYSQQPLILIGLDHYWNFIDHSKSYRVGNLVGQLSPFGYILSGRIEYPTDKISNHQMLCTSENYTSYNKRNNLDF